MKETILLDITPGTPLALSSTSKGDEMVSARENYELVLKWFHNNSVLLGDPDHTTCTTEGVLFMPPINFTIYWKEIPAVRVCYDDDPEEISYAELMHQMAQAVHVKEI